MTIKLADYSCCTCQLRSNDNWLKSHLTVDFDSEMGDSCPQVLTFATEWHFLNVGDVPIGRGD
jgi:hypothetical protein